ncbi:uncharacterized protein LOC111297656 [Durio zibethinus]|uniref:Uncharacterized protein LOC111297656 n=1 Tax=Durio zibethinus TaxID=66656 RepID=A0A6P5Z6Q5_DURZI|nr:uncharacterized protein LOC111297656 [Durio zibethinus]
MEMQNERERKVQQLKDIYHEHQPLVFNGDQQWDQSKETLCSACDRLLSGETYSCKDCEDYHIHKKCGEAPLELHHHPFHSQHASHVLQSSSGSWYICRLCRKDGKGISYECDSCFFSLDINCALLPLVENSQILKHDAHPHPLFFIQNHTDELKTYDCEGCNTSLVDSIYVCADCRFFLHKKCAELPTEINLPCHRDHAHPLILDFDCKYCFCKFCQAEHWGYFYRCSHCNIDIHMNCAWPDPVIEDKIHHEHPFNLFWRQDPFICNACGIEGNYASYICFICHLQVHPKCTSLPRIIKITRHNHPIFHNYFVQTKEFEKQDCQICFEEVKTRHGSYYCLKHDFNYIVHVNCATEDDDWYYIIDPENQDEAGENSEVIESSITRIVEENECGVAVKIKHFSHEHCLMLGDKINGDDDKYCDGCVLSISDLFYYCSECDFLLHKTCAELPMKRSHFWHQHLDTLKSEGIFKCDACSHQCSGFAYNCDECEFSACLKCANISDTVMYPGHKHLLFLDPKYEGKCTACGVEFDYAYRCTKKCNYALHWKCIILPHATPHKFDEHFLKLSYRDENDDPEQCFCDICEEKRDPNLWFYHCSICDASAHPECVLGEYPSIKIGSKYTYKDHPHSLTFVRKIYECPECDECGEPCQDLSLECAPCNYIVHWKCISPID